MGGLMPNRGCTTFVAAVLWLAHLVNLAGATEGEGLRLLLLGGRDVNTPQPLRRAEVAIEAETPGTEPRKPEAIALFAPGKDARWYIQVREPSLRSLVLGSERKVMERTDATTRTLPIGAPMDALGIAYEDL